ncbi:MAG: hypothetical protein K1X28_02485 [Parachlamydiales bacterium]|nr:hypothetical protein [Parachlamydiales bacterium]
MATNNICSIQQNKKGEWYFQPKFPLCEQDYLGYEGGKELYDVFANLYRATGKTFRVTGRLDTAPLGDISKICQAAANFFQAKNAESHNQEDTMNAFQEYRRISLDTGLIVSAKKEAAPKKEPLAAEAFEFVRPKVAIDKKAWISYGGDDEGYSSLMRFINIAPNAFKIVGAVEDLTPGNIAMVCGAMAKYVSAHAHFKRCQSAIFESREEGEKMRAESKKQCDIARSIYEESSQKLGIKIMFLENHS